MRKLVVNSHLATQDDVERSLSRLLSKTALCSVATLTQRGPWVATMYFARMTDYRLVVVTAPSSEHFAGLATDSRVALAIYDSAQEFNGPKAGLQLSGIAQEPGDDVDLVTSAKESYVARFPDAASWLSAVDAYDSIESRAFIIQIDTVKIFDEPTFGPETWISATVG